MRRVGSPSNGTVPVGATDMVRGRALSCAAGVKPAAKIVDPLSARGLVLLVPAKPIVLVAVDWEGIANEGWDEWRRAIADAVGTDMEHVSVHTLHQHDAPGYDPSAERLLQPRGLGEAIQKALTSSSP